MATLPRTWREIAFHHALHEAAHAVVAWIMTREHNDNEDARHRQQEPGFSRVFVRSLEAAAQIPGHGVGAIIRVAPYAPFGRYVPGDTALPQSIQERSRRMMAREITVALAGPLAEARYRHKSFLHMASTDSGCQSDLIVVRRCAADFSQSSGERAEIINGLVLRTRTLLRRRRVWGTILALANDLRNNRDLSGAQALRIMRDFWVEQADEVD